MAESGLSNLSIAAILVSALPPEADIQLILPRRAANDPKRILLIGRNMPESVNQLDKLYICTTLEKQKRYISREDLGKFIQAGEN